MTNSQLVGIVELCDTLQIQRPNVYQFYIPRGMPYHEVKGYRRTYKRFNVEEVRAWFAENVEGWGNNDSF